MSDAAKSSPPEEGSMNIQKPEAWPAWRVVLTDFAIVVLGVGVALAAQQVAETLHDRSRAAQARASIRKEIAQDLGAMDVRQVTEGCMTRKLDEVDGLIAAWSAGKPPQESLWIGAPMARTMIDGKYRAAIQSGAVSLFDDSEQAAYSGIYTMFAIYTQQLEIELLAWGDLRTMEKHPPPSPALDALWRSAIQRARTARWSVVVARQVAFSQASSIGILPMVHAKRKMPLACVPLHTPRDEALKQTAVPGLDLPPP